MTTKFKQFPSPHCHSAASLDTASTPEAFADWEVEHESGALTVTDHGTLGGARRIYDLATGKKYKGKLTPILGLEAYFRDDDCPILRSFGVEPQTWFRKPDTLHTIKPDEYEKKEAKSKKDYVPFSTTMGYQKYFHLTTHFGDQKAYETACRILSLADVKAEKHGSERKPLFGWKELEELGAENVTFGSSCLIGMVARHIAFGGRYDIAEAYYQKVRSLVRPGNFFVEVFPHVCDSNWESGILVAFEDGTEEKFWPTKKLKTDAGGEGVYAKDLASSWRAGSKATLVSVMRDREWVELPTPKAIVSVRAFEGVIQNECTVMCPNGDLQKPCNEFVIAMAQKYGDKILISDDSHFTSPDEKIVQDVKLGQGGGTWKFVTSYHRLTSEEAFGRFQQTLGTDEKTFEGWVDNNREWADKFKGFKFKDRKSLPTKFYPEDTLTHTFALIQKHGRQDCLRNPEYVQRLQQEIDLLHRNGTIDLLPYFMLDEEVCELYQSRGLLTGPGRGSAAGLLLCYLLEITHVDPLKYGLSLDRFLTLDRIQSGKLPDIDQDLPVRDLLVDPTDASKGWLYERFGDHVCRISTDTTLKLKSAVLDVHRLRSKTVPRSVPAEVSALAHRFAAPPQGIDNYDFVFGYKNDGEPVAGALEWDPPIIEYSQKYPEEWEIVCKCLGVPRNKGQHPCAYVIANEPVHNFIPTMSVGGVTVTQPTAAQVESSGGLKMDFLVVNSLNYIQAAIKLIQERSEDKSQPWGQLGQALMIEGRRVPLHRVIPRNGRYYDIWDLPEDQPVFRDICEGDTGAVFQFGTHSARQWLGCFNQVRFVRDGEAHKALDSIETLAAFTALDRPGPLDAHPEGATHNMLVEFARRAKGEAAIGSFPILDRLFPETYGVLTYQEQLQKAFQEVGGTTGIEANNFRVHVSKKQMKEVMADKEIFMRGAIPKIGAVAAGQLWQTMETFGQYGFNKSVDGTTILETCENKRKMLKDFIPGDLVWGVDEKGNKMKNTVVALHDHGTLPGFEVTFDDGASVVVSCNHKFLTPEGQKGLHDIVTRNLRVFAGTTSESIRMESEMRRDVCSAVGTKGPSTSMRCLSDGKTCEHTKTHGHTQYPARAKGGSVQGSNQNFVPAGYPASEGCTDPRLASCAPGTDSNNLGVCKESGQAFQNGGVAEVQRDSNMGRSPDSLRGGSQASRLCVSRPQDLGGGGRALPLLRSVQNESQATVHSVSRCDAEPRSSEKVGCDIDPTVWRLFQKLRREDESRMATMAYSDAPLSSTGSLVLRRIIRVRAVGPRHMYDLEVSHPKHNYLLPNGVVTSNSHAVCYTVIGYACAWLKHYYPLEWWTAVLRHCDKKELDEKYWKQCGHLIDLPDVSMSGDEFVIVNNRIRAPLNLLKGVGEVAHKELSKYRPFNSLEELLKKIDDRRCADGTTETKLTKKGIKVTVKKARTALHSGIINTLIVSGAMDSLFPAEMGVLDRLQLYLQVDAMITGKVYKRGDRTGQPMKKLPPKYLSLGAAQRYQIQKQVLPIYSENLIPLMLGFPGFELSKYGVSYNHQTLHRAEEIRRTLERNPWPEKLTVTMGAVAYVSKCEKKGYQDNTKTRAILSLDIEGDRYELVMWPDKDTGKLPEGFTDCTGAIVVVALRKYRGDRPFSIENLSVVQPALNEDALEESPDPEE